MAGHETDARQPINGIDLLDQIREVRLCTVRTDAAIGIDILSEQHDLFDTIADKRSDFFDDILRLPAPFPASGVRNDAVGAEIIAAVHDVDKRLVTVKSVCRQTLHDLAAVLPYSQLLLFLLIELIQKLRQLMQIIGAEDHIDPWIFGS